MSKKLQIGWLVVKAEEDCLIVRDDTGIFDVALSPHEAERLGEFIEDFVRERSRALR